MNIEDKILSTQPYDPEAAAEESIAGRANDLVNQLMHQLRGEYDLQPAIDRLSDDQKMKIHGRLMQITIAAMKGKPLAERPAAHPSDFSGQPLEPEPTGEVFQVQPGGLLLSQQKKL